MKVPGVLDEAFKSLDQGSSFILSVRWDGSFVAQGKEPLALNICTGQFSSL
ncbi:MAG: hypothetical protein WGN25_11025 [Candidatus Electrothrix sp. GW3-4]|uniref:hypothetical protein n=1 Tax=Candidatus Electrothrix sp. GW3-4 TaxID=3126740 RepID=UPI0030CAD7CE